MLARLTPSETLLQFAATYCGPNLGCRGAFHRLGGL